MPLLGPRIPAETLRRLWQMLAHNQGQLLNATKLAASLGVSGQTVSRYLDTLADLLLIRRLQPWMPNAGAKQRLPHRGGRHRRDKEVCRVSGHGDVLVGQNDRGDSAPYARAAAGEMRRGKTATQLPSAARRLYHQ
jgi:DNA-binding transcriptional ArsR family regulator